MKTCSMCGLAKQHNCFSPDRRISSGLQSRCKMCFASLAKQKRQQDPGKHRESVRKSTAKHYTAKLERNAIYRSKNPEKVSEWKQRDRTINKARVLADNAKRRSALVGETSPEIRQMYALRDFYKAMSLGDEFHVDHIVPIKHGGRHTYNNLRVIPAICNLRKGARL